MRQPLYGEGLKCNQQIIKLYYSKSAAVVVNLNVQILVRYDAFFISKVTWVKWGYLLWFLKKTLFVDKNMYQTYWLVKQSIFQKN